MTKQRLNIEVDVPDGYELVGFRECIDGDSYIYGRQVERWTGSNSTGMKSVIIKKRDMSILARDMMFRDMGVITDWSRATTSYLGTVVQLSSNYSVGIFALGLDAYWPNYKSLDATHKIRLFTPEEKEEFLSFGKDLINSDKI